MMIHSGQGSNICMASAVSSRYSSEREGQKFARLTCWNRTFSILSALSVRPFAVAAGAKGLRTQSQASVFTSEEWGDVRCCYGSAHWKWITNVQNIHYIKCLLFSGLLYSTWNRMQQKINIKVHSLLHKLCHRALGYRSRWLWWCHLSACCHCIHSPGFPVLEAELMIVRLSVSSDTRFLQIG